MHVTFLNPHHSKIYEKDTGLFIYEERVKKELPNDQSIEYMTDLVFEVLNEGVTVAGIKINTRQAADLRDRLIKMEDLKDYECKCRKEMYCPIHGDW